MGQPLGVKQSFMCHHWRLRKRLFPRLPYQGVTSKALHSIYEGTRSEQITGVQGGNEQTCAMHTMLKNCRVHKSTILQPSCSYPRSLERSQNLHSSIWILGYISYQIRCCRSWQDWPHNPIPRWQHLLFQEKWDWRVIDGHQFSMEYTSRFSTTHSVVMAWREWPPGSPSQSAERAARRKA